MYEKLLEAVRGNRWDVFPEIKCYDRGGSSFLLSGRWWGKWNFGFRSVHDGL
jgi:hypothetical protein